MSFLAGFALGMIATAVVAMVFAKGDAQKIHEELGTTRFTQGGRMSIADQRKPLPPHVLVSARQPTPHKPKNPRLAKSLRVGKPKQGAQEDE